VNCNQTYINSHAKMRCQLDLASHPGPPGMRQGLASEAGLGAERAGAQKNFLAT
jgi:hypothetical protein